MALHRLNGGTDNNEHQVYITCDGSGHFMQSGSCHDTLIFSAGLQG